MICLMLVSTSLGLNLPSPAAKSAKPAIEAVFPAEVDVVQVTIGLLLLSKYIGVGNAMETIPAREIRNHKSC
jgi:hypothetical protein